MKDTNPHLELGYGCVRPVFWMTVVSRVFSLFESDIIACLGKHTHFDSFPPSL